MLAQVANAIEETAAYLRRENISETDLRLFLLPDGGWTLREGSVQFDPDSPGYVGCATLSVDEYDAAELARVLIEDAEEFRAQCEEA